MAIQFIRFALVGTAGSVTNLSVFALTVRVFELNHNVGAVLAFLLAVTQDFALNRAWTFAAPGKTRVNLVRSWGKYVGVNLLGLAINLSLLNVVVLWAGAHWVLEAQLLGIIAAAGFNFLLVKKIVFDASEKKPVSRHQYFKSCITWQQARSQDVEKEPMPSQSLQFFVRFVWAGLALALMYSLAMRGLGFGYPWDTFLFIPADRFNDWHNSVAAAATFDPYYTSNPAPSAYFPIAYLVLFLGGGWPRGISTAVFLLVSVALLFVAVRAAVRHLSPRQEDTTASRTISPALLMVTLLFSYPVLFALDRGNLDIWIAALCTIFVAYLSTARAWIGFAALTLAISFKGYPVAFLVLAISQGRYRSAGICVAAAAGATALTLSILNGGFDHNLTGFLKGLQRYHEGYVVGGNSLFASADPYNGLRSLILMTGAPATPVAVWSAKLLGAYTFVSFAFACICAIYVLIVPGPFWRRVTVIGLLVLIFPNVANDYKLTMLIPGLLALLLSEERDRVPQTICVLVLLSLLMVPKSYLFINGVGLSNVIEPLLLIALSLVLLFDAPGWTAGVRRAGEIAGSLRRRLEQRPS